MKSYREILQEANRNRTAIGHFNISTVEMLWAIFDSARALNVPVLIGVAEGERDFIGVRQSVQLIRSLREQFDYPIYLNADHTYSFDRVKEAIDAGFDSVIFDGAKLPFEENLKITKQCVDYARAGGRDIIVEAELGYIGAGSQILDKIPDGVGLTEAELTKPEEAQRFVEETGIDLFAPAVGNIHGMLRDVPDPRLDIPRVKAISDSVGIPLVLHGGSGNSTEDFGMAMKNGVSIIHISTELRRAWRDGIALHLKNKPDDVAPYKVLAEAKQAVANVVTEKLKLFNNL